MSIIVKRNDFQIKLVIYENGAEIDNPVKYDFVRTYKVRTPSGEIKGNYLVSYLNGIYTNCKLIDNSLIATFVDHDLPFGELISNHSWKMPADTNKGYLLIGEQDNDAPAYVNAEFLTIQGARGLQGLQGVKGDKGDTPDVSQIEDIANQALSQVETEIINRKSADTILTASIAEVQTMAGNAVDNIGNKVDKVAGKGLSTNDYTTDEKDKLADLKTSDIKHGVRPLNLWMQGVDDYQTKADDLHNAVFADATKAVNTANAASAKVLEIDEFHSVILNDHEARITAEEAKTVKVTDELPKLWGWITSSGGLHPDAIPDTEGIDNVQEIIEFLDGIADSAVLKDLLANKVEKSVGKGLSSNDFTKEDKAKLATININDIALAVNTANAASAKVEEIDASHCAILNTHEERISENEQSLKDLILATNNNGWRELIESSFNANNYSRMRCVFIYQLSGRIEYATMLMEIDIDTIRDSAVNTGINTYKQYAIIYPAAPDMALSTVIEFSITFDKADQTAQFYINNAPNYIQTTKYYLQ